MVVGQASLMRRMRRTWSDQGQGRALEAEAVTSTKARLWCRNMPTDGRESRAAGGSTVNEAKEQDEAYGQLCCTKIVKITDLCLQS